MQETVRKNLVILNSFQSLRQQTSVQSSGHLANFRPWLFFVGHDAWIRLGSEGFRECPSFDDES